jgi:hypothetical protein
MYLTPTKYRCEQGHEFSWSPSYAADTPHWPTTARDLHPTPVCPTCWNAFLLRERLLMTPVRELKP